MTPLLSVRDLRTSFFTEAGMARAVDGVSFDVAPGEILGIVGESGSGKSVTAMSVLGLVPQPPGRIQATGIFWKGRDLLGLSQEEMRAIRGDEIAMIFQDPLTALNPVITVGKQIAEVATVHSDISAAEARARAIEMLALVGLPQPDQRADEYPHQFSGGMRQRAMIAMALVREPDLLIADEPTTALDVTIQAQVLEVLTKAAAATGSSVILITHDLGVVAGMADRVAVMYGGQIVEQCDVEDLYYRARMPYTWGLLGSLPRVDRRRVGRLRSIAGQPPSLLALPPGCRFETRCLSRAERCATTPPEVAPEHRCRCHFAGEPGWWSPTERLAEPAELWHPLVAQAERRLAAEESTNEKVAVPTPTVDPGEGDGPLVEISHLTKHFPLTRGLLRRRAGAVQAVDDVSFTVARGETFGLVGESGCGKTTVARLLLKLIAPTAGELRFDGRDISNLGHRATRALRAEMQIVFQDPFSSLNPRRSVRQIIAEPLVVHGTARRETGTRVDDLLELCGLSAEHAQRFPHQLSGGQRQRVGVARALALNPKLVVLDEPVSALDVSVQAQIVNLLEELQDRLGLTYLVIAHNLSFVRHISDTVGVMYLGRLMELAGRDRFYERPMHPYSVALLSAMPVPDPVEEHQRERIILVGDVPSPRNPPPACRFETRCWKAEELCRTVAPQLVEKETGHWVACHFPENATPAPSE